jgi:hypothetical protein
MPPYSTQGHCDLTTPPRHKNLVQTTLGRIFFEYSLGLRESTLFQKCPLRPVPPEPLPVSGTPPRRRNFRPGALPIPIQATLIRHRVLVRAAAGAVSAGQHDQPRGRRASRDLSQGGRHHAGADTFISTATTPDNALGPTSSHFPDRSTFENTYRDAIEAHWRSLNAAQLAQETPRGFATFESFSTNGVQANFTADPAAARSKTPAAPNLTSSAAANVKLPINLGGPKVSQFSTIGTSDPNDA